MFDPSIGRWIEEAPIGTEGGEVNLYRYAGNSPTSATDPSGLKSTGEQHATGREAQVGNSPTTATDPSGAQLTGGQPAKETEGQAGNAPMTATGPSGSQTTGEEQGLRSQGDQRRRLAIVFVAAALSGVEITAERWGQWEPTSHFWQAAPQGPTPSPWSVPGHGSLGSLITPNDTGTYLGHPLSIGFAGASGLQGGFAGASGLQGGWAGASGLQGGCKNLGSGPFGNQGAWSIRGGSFSGPAGGAS